MEAWVLSIIIGVVVVVGLEVWRRMNVFCGLEEMGICALQLLAVSCVVAFNVIYWTVSWGW